MRVYTLAKELGLSSKDLLLLLQDLNIDAKSHMSTIDEKDKQKVLDKIQSESNPTTPKEKKESEKKNTKESKDSEEKNSKKIEKENKKSSDKEKNKGKKEKKSSEEDPRENLSNHNRKNKKNVERFSKNNLGDEKEEPTRPRKKSRSQKRRENNAKRKSQEENKGDETIIKIQAPITVKEFSEAIDVNVAQIIKKLIGYGIMATQNESIDEDTILILADEFGKEVEFGFGDDEKSVEEIFNLDAEDPEESLKPRSPVVTVMGHVDHGKTSLLDVIKKSHVTASEAGGITQHIGAYTVNVKGNKITFLDTPGHEAFTSMRSRGASITDIAILVVAADDGVMPQTIEAINHAKAANVPIIVAINKIDREGANVDRVKQELTEHGLIPEDWGGDTITVNVSAVTKEGIPDLLEMIQLVAEVQELKANPNRLAVGSVIEAKLDKGKGPMATILVQKGTLNHGDFLVSGTSYGHIRAMTDDKKKKVKKAGPSSPVVVLGLNEVPNAGEMIYAVKDEKTAKAAAARNFEINREEKLASKSKISLDNLFDKIKEGELKDLNIIVKADVKGTVEAINQSLMKLSNEEVKINIIHSGAGGINEGDVNLASASNALVVGFNVRPNINALDLAKQEEVDIRTYRVIYDIINDVKAAVSGLLEPTIVEEVLGRCEVRDTFKLPNNNIVAGIYVLKGKIVRNGLVKVLRDDIVIFEGPIASLKRFKDDAKEIAQGYEGGLMVDNFNDIKVNDLLECYVEKEVKKELD